MDIKPIKSNREAESAKQYLAKLMRTNSTGELSDEIAVRATLIEQFEKTQLRLDPPSPIAAIRFRMQEMGLNPKQLEPFIGTRARVSEILSGKRSLSIEMMRALHEGLNIPYESLMSERRSELSDIPAPAVERLNKFGFDVEHQTILPFVERSFADPPIMSSLHRRTRTQRTTSKTDQRALMLWEAAVRTTATAKSLSTSYNPAKLTDAFLRQLAWLSPRPNGPELAVAAVEDIGIVIVFLPPLPSTFLDGAAMLDKHGRPVVALTLRHDRVDSFWFSLFHEISHIRLHLADLRQGLSAFFDDIDIESDDRRETEADMLARTSLVPDACVNRVHWSEKTTLDDITRVASQSRVHIAIVAGRWQREFQNYRKFARLIERGTIRSKFF